MVKSPKASAKKAVSKTSASAKAQRSENPMDWLFDNPLGSYPNFGFGVLKQAYHGFRNSPSEFAIRKLVPAGAHDIELATFDPEVITAHRHGTIPPPDAIDALDATMPALKLFDLAALPTEAAILVSVTLGFPEATRLHHAWEESRAFCYQNLARKRQLLTLLVQHRPGEVGSDNPTHCHLLICPRRIDGTGFRGFAEDLLCDEGQRVLHAEWVEFRRAWQEGAVRT